MLAGLVPAEGCEEDSVLGLSLASRVFLAIFGVPQLVKASLWSLPWCSLGVLPACVSVSRISLFYKDISHIGLGPTHLTTFYYNYFVTGLITRYSYMWGTGWLGLSYMNWWGSGQSIHNSSFKRWQPEDLAQWFFPRVCACLEKVSVLLSHSSRKKILDDEYLVLISRKKKILCPDFWIELTRTQPDLSFSF